MDIRYRQVRKEDGYEWYTLIGKVWRIAYKDIFPEEVFAARDASLDAKVSEFSEGKFMCDRKIAYVAECDGKIVGVMFGTLDSNYEYFLGDYADLVALYVYPEYQGMGVGTALKDIFVEWARSKGVRQFVIGVLKENYKARRVYESWGGKLSTHEQDFVTFGNGYPEAFYTFEV